MRHGLVALFSAVFLVSCATPTREQSLVDRAVEAMGGAERIAALKTVTFKGTAKFWEPEQSDVPGGESRFVVDAPFEGIYDPSSRAIRIDWEKNMAYIPRTFKYSEIVTPAAGYVIGVDSSGRNAQSLQSSPPAHTMSGARLAAAQRELLRGAVTGLVLAMHRNPDALRPAADLVAQGRNLPAVSFQSFVVGFDPQTGLPALARTLDYDNIWGDVNFDYSYSDWRDFSGVKIPLARKYELNGKLIQEVQFTELRYNQPIDGARLQIPPAALAGAAKPAARNVPYQWVLRRQNVGFYLDSEHLSYDTRAPQGLRLQETAPGVHQIQGGTHNSLVVEMSDHLIVLDAPITDAQSMWLVGATRAQFPGKPIRWLVLTHHHMDHAGGLRGILAEGGTLVVGQGAGAHFRRVLSAPMTRNPDLPARSFHMTPILEVPESHVMSDASGRQVIAYVMDNPHAKGMLMGWVPH
ncbi:MAG TPA: MBL fold metallo-hydrolase, partial [Burkholderiales bacterium]|nr:MBL fold metallo-hydrolase [Burkholderiales bacterium]